MTFFYFLHLKEAEKHFDAQHILSFIVILIIFLLSFPFFPIFLLIETFHFLTLNERKIIGAASFYQHASASAFRNDFL
jgi:hypothetical protein